MLNRDPDGTGDPAATISGVASSAGSHRMPSGRGRCGARDDRRGSCLDARRCSSPTRGAGFEMVARAGDAEALLRETLADRPDVVAAYVHVPVWPRRRRCERSGSAGGGSNGRALVVLRGRLRPQADSRRSRGRRLPARGARARRRGVRPRIARVAAGRSALDPEVMARMLGRARIHDALHRLSPRERDVRAAMAEGKSYRGIAKAPAPWEAAVESNMTTIFRKLGPRPHADRTSAFTRPGDLPARLVLLTAGRPYSCLAHGRPPGDHRRRLAHGRGRCRGRFAVRPVVGHGRPVL
jgi:hypothetical protein